MDQEIILGITIIVLSLIVGLIVVSFILTWLRSHRLRIRDPLNKSQYITEYWVTEKKDKETGYIDWKSVWFQPKLRTARPPDKAIHVGKKGRMYAEAYRITEGEFYWIADKGVTVEEEIDEATGKVIARNIVDVQQDGKYKVVDTFEPFSKTQRMALISQYKKAELTNKNKWDAQKVMQMASMGLFAVVIVCFLIFGSDIYSSMTSFRKESGGLQIQTLELQKEVAEANAKAATALAMNLDNLDIQFKQTPDQQGGIAITTDEEEPPFLVEESP